MRIRRALLNRLPGPIRTFLRTMFVGKKPDLQTSQGVSHEDWVDRQIKEELKYWEREFPKKLNGREPADWYREHYQKINAAPFHTLSFGSIVVDVGCGPFGSLTYDRPIIGVEPLARAFDDKFGYPKEWKILDCPAEEIDYPSNSTDTVVCINALDHFRNPYEALSEITRILKPGGDLYMSTDVGGTPGHPCHIVESELTSFLNSRFAVKQQECSTELPTTWPAEMQIPLYVFHGKKL